MRKTIWKCFKNISSFQQMCLEDWESLWFHVADAGSCHVLCIASLHIFLRVVWILRSYPVQPCWWKVSPQIPMECCCHLCGILTEWWMWTYTFIQLYFLECKSDGIEVYTHCTNVNFLVLIEYYNYTCTTIGGNWVNSTGALSVTSSHLPVTL